MGIGSKTVKKKINRRSFIGAGLAIPLVGAFSWGKSPQQPHFLMPYEAWGILGTLTMLKCRNFIEDDLVSSASALVIAEVVTESWNDIPWWVDFLCGIHKPSIGFDNARKWLTGDGWDQRLGCFLDFVRQGGFRVEEQENGAVMRLVRVEARIGMV